MSLAVLILTAFLYLAGRAEMDVVKKWMLAMTVVWFVSAAFWMWDSKK
jgi:hypothetical protein